MGLMTVRCFFESAFGCCTEAGQLGKVGSWVHVIQGQNGGKAGEEEERGN